MASTKETSTFQKKTGESLLKSGNDDPPQNINTGASAELLNISSKTYSHNLPTPLAKLVGREEELNALNTLLQTKRLITLFGPGGVGKSRLALETAWKNLPNYSDGVYLVRLESINAPEFLVSTLADTLSFRFYRSGDPKAQLIDYLRPRKTLVVLDNFEHMLAMAEILADIVQQAPGVSILVTSRERLRLYEESIFEVKGLLFPSDELPETGNSYSAVQFFLQSLEKVRSNVALNADERKQVMRICRFLEGLPLAIELAAACNRALPLDDIAHEIEHSLDFLTSPWANQAERHQSLRIVFEHSWNSLNASEREVFAGLSVFRGSIRRSAIGFIIQASPSTLLGLVDKSLLRWNPATERYETHPVLQQYATEKLAAAPEQANQVHERYSNYYLGWLASYEAALLGSGQTQALAEIGAEIANIRQAWGWAAENARLELLERGLDSLYRFFWMRSRWQEGLEAFAQAATRLRQAKLSATPPAQFILQKLLIRQGRFLELLERYADAHELLQPCLDAFRTQSVMGDCERTLETENIQCMVYLGRVKLAREDYPEARELFENARLRAQALQASALEATALHNLGGYHWFHSQYTEARSCCEQSLQIVRKTGDWMFEAIILNGLSKICIGMGDWPTARVYSEQALQRYHELGNRWGESDVLTTLGIISEFQGRYDEALQSHITSLAIDREIGANLPQGYSRISLGDVWAKLGDFPAARENYEQALNTFQKHNIPRTIFLSLRRLSKLALASGDAETALEYSQEMLRLTQEHSDLLEREYVWRHLGQAQAAAGHLDEAVAMLRQALALQRETNNRVAICEALSDLAQAYLSRAELSLAGECIQELMGDLTARTLDSSAELFEIYLTCYRVLSANQDPRAQKILQTAYGLLQEQAKHIGDEKLHRSFLENVATNREILTEFSRHSTALDGATGLVKALTSRELEVLCLMAEGLSNPEIAERLVVSKGTVKVHTHSIYRKLESSTRLQTVNRARELGLL